MIQLYYQGTAKGLMEYLGRLVRAQDKRDLESFEEQLTWEYFND